MNQETAIVSAPKDEDLESLPFNVQIALRILLATLKVADLSDEKVRGSVLKQLLDIVFEFPPLMR